MSCFMSQTISCTQVVPHLGGVTMNTSSGYTSSVCSLSRSLDLGEEKHDNNSFVHVFELIANTS